MRIIIDIEEVDNGAWIGILIDDVHVVKIVAEKLTYAYSDRTRDLLLEYIGLGYDSWKRKEKERQESAPTENAPSSSDVTSGEGS